MQSVTVAAAGAPSPLVAVGQHAAGREEAREQQDPAMNPILAPIARIYGVRRVTAKPADGGGAAS